MSWRDNDSTNPIDEDGGGDEGTVLTWSATNADTVQWSLDGGAYSTATAKPAPRRVDNVATTGALTAALASPSASVIICAYTDRRWAVLEASIHATLGQRPPPREIVLVVDHNDALLRRCRAQLPPEVRVLANTEARGLSGARNTGIQYATGAPLIFLDDDAVPEPGWMAALLGLYNDERVVGVGGGVVPDWAAGQPGWLPAEFWWTVGCSYRGLPTDSAPIRNAIGANMSFRRSAFDQVGSFTDGIGRLGSTPLVCEETEFSIRLRQHMPHVVILYVPHARVSHLVPDERAR